MRQMACARACVPLRVKSKLNLYEPSRFTRESVRSGRLGFLLVTRDVTVRSPRYWLASSKRSIVFRRSVRPRNSDTGRDTKDRAFSKKRHESLEREGAGPGVVECVKARCQSTRNLNNSHQQRRRQAKEHAFFAGL